MYVYCAFHLLMRSKACSWSLPIEVQRRPFNLQRGLLYFRKSINSLLSFRVGRFGGRFVPLDRLEEELSTNVAV